MSKPAAAAGGTTVTLRPNATAADGSGDGRQWFPTSGPTLHGVTSDNSDSTYAAGSAGVTDDGEGNPVDAQGTLILDLGTFSFGASTITSVTIRVRWGGTSGCNLSVKQRSGGSDSAADSHTGIGGGGATVTGATRTTKPGGGAWDQTAIDGLQVKILGTGTVDVHVWSLIEVYADVVYT